VPYLYQILDRLDIDKLNVPSLRTLTQAGGKLIPSLIEKFHGRISARGGRMFVMYGQTEATARIAVLPWQDLPAKLGSAGLALPGGKLTIEDGEVIYEGPNVMQGYALNRADLALGDQLQGRLKTGDRGRLDADGYLYLEGRNSREVKVFGLRVNLDEVEALLRVHGPTAVLAREEGMVAFCDWGDEEFRAAQRGALAAKLNLAHRAVELRYLHPIPTAASGKIAYDQLKELL
jgi:acyl-coenzyme A synthetase/AMP-(fatty) acid ligase